MRKTETILKIYIEIRRETLTKALINFNENDVEKYFLSGSLKEIDMLENNFKTLLELINE